MTGPYDLYETDPELESGKGVEIPYKGFSVTIHRAGGANRRYQKVLNEKMELVRNNATDGTLSDEDALRISAEVYAETIIIGWKNVKDRDGKPLKFSKENVVKVLTDLPDFFQDIQFKANSLAQFKKKRIEADAKN